MVVKAYYQIALKGKAGVIYNLCSGKACSLKVLLEHLVLLSTADVHIEIDDSRFGPFDLPIMLRDNTRIINEIGWKPEIDIYETLNDLLNYWRSHTTT